VTALGVITAGPLEPSTHAGGVSFTSPENAKVDDGAVASQTLGPGQATSLLALRDFGIDLPAEAQVIGWKIGVEHRSSLAAHVVENRIELSLDGVTADLVTGAPLGTSLAFQAYGGYDDVAGLSDDVSTWEAGGGAGPTINLRYENDGGGDADVEVDVAQLAIAYRLPLGAQLSFEDDLSGTDDLTQLGSSIWVTTNGYLEVSSMVGSPGTFGDEWSVLHDAWIYRAGDADYQYEDCYVEATFRGTYSGANNGLSLIMGSGVGRDTAYVRIAINDGAIVISIRDFGQAQAQDVVTGLGTLSYAGTTPDDGVVVRAERRGDTIEVFVAGGSVGSVSHPLIEGRGWLGVGAQDNADSGGNLGWSDLRGGPLVASTAERGERSRYMERERL